MTKSTFKQPETNPEPEESFNKYKRKNASSCDLNSKQENTAKTEGTWHFLINMLL